MDYQEESITDMCVLFSFNRAEYADYLKTPRYKEDAADILREPDSEVTVHILRPIGRALDSEEFLELLDCVGELKLAVSPELWFFGSDLNVQVFKVLKHVSGNTLVRNMACDNTALDTYLQLLGYKNAQA